MRNTYLSLACILFFTAPALAQNNVGVDVPSPQEKLDVAGRLRLSPPAFDDAAGAPTGGAGTIRWNATAGQFEGYTPSGWVSFNTPTGLLSQTLQSGHIFVGNASNVATGVAMGGDATITNAGVLTIGNDAVTTAKILNGAVTTAKILNGTILNEDIDNAAAIARTKLANGAAHALVVNDASGVMAELAPGANGNILTSTGTQWQSADPGTVFIRNQIADSQSPANFRISGRGIVGNGIAADPSLSFEGSQTTGIFRPAADVLGISIKGVERMRVYEDVPALPPLTPYGVLQMDGNFLFQWKTLTERVISVENGPNSNNAAVNGGNALRVRAGSAFPGAHAAAGGDLELRAGNANTGGSDNRGSVHIISGGNTYQSSTSGGNGHIILSTGGNSNGLPATTEERMRIANNGDITLPTLNLSNESRLLSIGPLGEVTTSGIIPANVGTVTSVSVTTANGVSGTVANPNTTPAISLTLGAITPSSVAATGTVTGFNLSGTNTGD